MRLPLLALLLIASSALAQADVELAEVAKRMQRTEQALRQSLADCDRYQGSMNDCAGYAYHVKDIALTKVYKELINSTGTLTAKRMLVSSQRAWIVFRDRDCAYEASGVEGGSMHAGLVYRCLAERTASRIQQLDAMLACTAPGCHS
jgi:uncharacterized protein YecT (DUF1311 family)